MYIHVTIITKGHIMNVGGEDDMGEAGEERGAGVMRRQCSCIKF